MEDRDAQQDEILALQSIFDDSQIHVDSSGTNIVGCIFIKPEIGDITIQAVKNDQLHTFTVKHLCPNELHFTFPNNYPSFNPPSFTLVSKWLKRDQLSKLCKLMDQKWENELKGQVVLFDWIQFLQYELTEVLDMDNTVDLSWAYYSNKLTARKSGNFSELDEQLVSTPTSGSATKTSQQLDTRAVTDNQFKTDLLEFLIEYDKSQMHIIFEKSFFTCKVCFAEKLGSAMMQFPICNHVFCKECMKDYFVIRIADGVASGLSCPEEKCTSVASPGQVKELVPPEAFARYDMLLLESTIASMMNLNYCPRPTCQYPVSVENETTMGSCPACQFHFCLLCKATYHGVAPCKMNIDDKMKLVELYLNGSHQEKENLERRYGKTQLKTMVDEIQTASWMSKHSKTCPHCNAPIEKQDGCNKMTCMRCMTYFCWICNAQLDPRCPYLHFSSTNAKCVLFEDIDDDDGPGWIDIVDESDSDFSDDE